MEGKLRLLWLLALISCLCAANGRQIRISRYTTEAWGNVDADTVTVEPLEIEATVREIKLTPYPPAGYRPWKAFPLPQENGDDLSDSESQPEGLALTTTTTEGYASETTTARGDDEDYETQESDVKAPYPAAGFRPKIPFNLPTTWGEVEVTTATPLADFTTRAVETWTTPGDLAYLLKQQQEEQQTTETPLAELTTKATELEVNAPYPAAGFRPKIPFLLPQDKLIRDDAQEPDQVTTETPLVMETELEVKAPYPAAGFRPYIPFNLPTAQLTRGKDQNSAKEDNSNHPVCGSSTNPLAPKPIDGEKPDPDSETIFTSPQTVVLPVRLTAQPLSLA